MQIKFGRKFTKQYEKAGAEIRSLFDERLKLFIQDPFQLTLNNHPLTGKLKGFRSINITGDWRAIYSQSSDPVEGKVIIFEMLGTHSKLYK